jgi:hypothetical protein
LTFAWTYDMPFGKAAMATGRRWLDSAIGGWSLGGVIVSQSGTPILISGANSGSINGLPDRVPGEPLEVPQNLQRWYDSPNTADRTVTLPGGRRMVVCRFCFLKFNPDAFRGRVLNLPGNRVVADTFWWGDSASTITALRNPGMTNINLSVDRRFGIKEGMWIEFSAQATNFLNHTQFRPAYNGGLGGTQLRNEPANGFIPGLGSNDNYGTIGLNTFDPRQIELQLRFRF